eukprot:s3539_g8.t1
MGLTGEYDRSLFTWGKQRFASEVMACCTGACGGRGFGERDSALGEEVDVVMVRQETGARVFRIWRFEDLAVVFREDNPPTVVLAARLITEGPDIKSSFALMSGELLSEGIFDRHGVEGPLLMGHLSMLAYRAASDANLIESVYQAVKAHSSRRKTAQVAVDASAAHLDHLDLGTEEVWSRRGSRNGSSKSIQGSLAQQKAKDISGETMYITLLVVILTGIALGVLIPLGVNYYYEEMATPPWLRDLLNEVAAPRHETGESAGTASSAGPRVAGESAPRGRSVDEEIYARSPYESPRVRRQRSSSSTRRRRARAREARDAAARQAASPQQGEAVSYETSAGEADVSTGDDFEKATLARLPKIPQEHPLGPKQISSDEAGDSPGSAAAARLRLLRNEWLQAGRSGRGITEKRVSEESTTAAEDSTSSSSLHRIVRDSRRGRSPDEPQTPKSSSSKRTVSFDNKVEVKNLESEQPMTLGQGLLDGFLYTWHCVAIFDTTGSRRTAGRKGVAAHRRLSHWTLTPLNQKKKRLQRGSVGAWGLHDLAWEWCLGGWCQGNQPTDA